MAILPTEIYSLEEFFQNNSDIKKSELRIIREWLDKQPHLPKIEDEYLILFLNSNYFRIEATKTTIENYYTFKTHVPEYFGNRDPFLKEIRSQHTVVRVIPAKIFTKEGYQIIYVDFMDPDPCNYVFFDATKYFLMIAELATNKIGPISGLVFVIDVQNVSLAHIARMNIMGMKKFLYLIQEASPVRLKHIYIFNGNSAVETLLNMLKPFMKKKLYELIVFTTLQKLEQLIPLDALPNEVGGKSGNLKDLVDEQTKLLDDNREYFLMDEAKNRVNESLRIGKPKSANDLFGIDGSFKKLDID